MRFLLGIFLLSLFLWGEGQSEKLIVASYQDEMDAEIDILLLEGLFSENRAYAKIEARYNLELEIEKLGNFYILSIQPIDTLEIKNALLLLLHKQFPNLFFIDNIRLVFDESPQGSEPKKSLLKKQTRKNEIPKVQQWFEGLELQWFVLWSLSVLGLILSIRSRRNLLKLAQTQEDFNQWQKKIEDEIQHLKGQDVS